MTVGEGGGAVGSHSLRWLCLAVSILAVTPVAAQEPSPESSPQISEAEAEAEAEAEKLADQERKALEAAEGRIEAEERRGIDAEAPAAEAAEEQEQERQPEAETSEAEETAGPDTPPPAPPVEEAQTIAPWAPPGPDSSAYDWLQTKSGEWLKGEFERLRDRVVEFDSDEFDRQKIDWKDVAYFRFTRPHTYRFEGRRIYWGPAEMRKGVIKVRTSEGVIELPQREVVSITRGTVGNEIDYWSALISVGTSLRSGNTDETNFSGRGKIMRETALTRLSLDYTGAFSRVDGSTTDNTHRSFFAYDVFLTRRFYVTLAYLEFFKDENQRIDRRFTPGSGIGYELVKNDWADAETSLGVGAQHTRFDTGNEDLDAAIIYTLETELELPYDVDWDSKYTLQLIPTDFGKTSHHAESVLSFEIYDPIDLDFVFVWDRIESPESQEDQSKPEKDDYRLSIELAIDW
jgi:hypothetical protein